MAGPMGRFRGGSQENNYVTPIDYDEEETPATIQAILADLGGGALPPEPSAAYPTPPRRYADEMGGDSAPNPFEQDQVNLTAAPADSDRERKIKQAAIASAIQSAMAGRTSAPIETAFYAFTGEKLPSHQGEAKVDTALDVLQQQDKIREGQTTEDLRRAQIEKYLAEAKNKAASADQQWVDTGIRGRTEDGKEGMIRLLNKKTGEVKDVPNLPGGYDRLDLQLGNAIGLKTMDIESKSSSTKTEQEFKADQARKEREFKDQQRKEHEEFLAQLAKDRTAASAAAKKGAQGLTKAETVTGKEGDAILAIDDAIQEAKNLRDYFLSSPPKDRTKWVGPLDSAMPGFTVGPDESKLRTYHGQMYNAYKHMISGTAVSPTEKADLSAAVPMLSDKPDNFEAKTATYLDILQKRRANLLKNLGQRGRVTKSFETAPANDAPAGAVRLKGRDGWYMKTPEGYKKVK